MNKESNGDIMLKFLVNSLSWLLGICFNALIFVVLGYLVYTYAIRGFQFGEEFSTIMTNERESYEIEFILDDDTPVAEVAQMLEDMGIIESALMYRLELTIMGSTDDYVAGTFMLDKSLSTTQLNNRLRRRPVDPVIENRIMIPEGFTQQDIAIYLESRGFFSSDEFMYTANNHDFGFRFLEDIPNRPSRLEGYLFPDTYFVTENPTAEEVIIRMLSRFNEVFNFEYRMRAEELGLTIDQVVNIAAMIEREVRVPDERPMVARVIYNRLAIGMPLQIDATVAYAHGMHMDRVMYRHTELASPFNTYYVSGLPLGPIANPGAASINAALFPNDGDWLFYVLVNADTGAHFFTADYSQHLHARQHYMPRPWDD